MSKYPLQSVLVWLSALGFLLQSFCTGVPAGQRLCLGCEGSGWTVSTPVEIGAERGCCGEDGDGTPQKNPTAPIAPGERDCGCVDVPLVSGTALAVAAPRADRFEGSESDSSGLTAVLPRAMAAEARWIGNLAETNSSFPPRLPTPRSRRTVLVL